MDCWQKGLRMPDAHPTLVLLRWSDGGQAGLGTVFPANLRFPMNLSSLSKAAAFLWLAASALAIDPEVDGYLKASNTRFSSFFGKVVAMSGSTMVVGAPYEDGASTGVNGNQNNFNGVEVGAAYVFVRVGTEWVQQAYLKPSTYNSFDHFGASVAISGDTIVVGAPGEDSKASGVNGDQTDNTLAESGAAYVFVRQGNSWIQQAYLKASNPGNGDDFGFSVGVDGNLIAVSAPDEDSSGREINGDQSTNNGSNSGAVYVFARSGSTWKQQAFLKAANADVADGFGYSIAVSGATVAVGAPFEASRETDPADNSGNDNGAVYVFVRSLSSVWTQEAYIKAGQYSDTLDQFGFSVAISTDTLVVGAPGEDGKGIKVNGPEYDNTVQASGAAYVFHREGSTWSRQAYLKSNVVLSAYLEAGNELDKFGTSVAICGERVVVGCPHHNQEVPNNTDIGAAFLYQRQDMGWNYVSELYPHRATYSGYYYDEFGTSVAVSDKFAAVGAPNEDSPSKGTHGDPSLGGENDSGAVYTFLVGPQVVSIARSGMPAPGGPSIAFGRIGDVCMDGSALGQVLFQSSLTGPGAPAGQTQAVFDVEHLSDLVWMSMRTGTPMGGILGLPSTARISALSNPVNIGAFHYAYYQATVGSNRVVLVDDGASVQPVFRTGMPVPALSNASISTILDMLPGSGQDALAVHYKLGGVSAATDSGFMVLDHNGAVLNPGLREGSSFFGMGAAKFGQMVRVARGLSGATCIVKMLPGNGQAAKDTVCSLTQPLTPMQGDLAGDTMAGERYGTFTGLGTMGTFSLLKATLTHCPASTNEGLWLDNGVLVARKGQDIGGGVKIARFIRVWANDAPHYLLHVVLSGPGVTRANNVALLLKPHTSPNFQVLVRTGFPVPGISDPALKVRSISAIDTASAGGHYMVLATITGPSSANQVLLAGRTAIGDNVNYAYQRRPQLLLRKGDKLHTASTPGSTVTSISIRPVLHPSGVGNYGERRQVNAGFAAAVVSTSAGGQELLRIAY